MSGDITRLLQEWKAGNARAGEELIARTYPELRRVAHAHLRRERRGHTLQTTAILHEAYLRLLRKGPGSAEDREAFFRLMAAEIRHRLIDHARRRLANKRGRGVVHENCDVAALATRIDSAEDIEPMLTRLDRALDGLGRSFPRAAQVVQLRFLAGLTMEETAKELDLSVGTIKREWTFARAWLAAAIEGEPHASSQQ
jgi:RNA polymerase sigma factor (TIGR02999 family)